MAKIETKPVKGFPSYSVTSTGVVYSSKRGDPTEVKGSVWMGYRKVALSNGSKVKTIAVHRLVAETFLTKPRGFNVVNHIDGDKSNNNLSNLEWTNHRGNSKHYGEKLAPVYKVRRVKEKQDKLNNNLAVVKFAYITFKDDPESFGKVFGAVFAV
jgi:hypothetical protein